MDDLVKRAMAKWPNVPHCYGWLLLDARGAWRMRDERAQAFNLPGERINNAALLDFIHRNYTHDGLGRWYFQNGPQRVYVDLAVTPFIVRMDPAHELILHTGAPLAEIDSVWMTEYGQLILHGMENVALLDDRDLGQCLDGIRIVNEAPTEDGLSNWLAGQHGGKPMTWLHQGKTYPVKRILLADLADRFKFVLCPRPSAFTA